MYKVSYSPIVIFVYRRLHHTRLTIESLLQCEESIHSELYIFSDAPKSRKDDDDVIKVRNYIKTIRGFKRIFIIYRESNFGLAKNIILGLNGIFKEHEKAIILEDDIVVSRYFLKFMNAALDLYRKESKIWHVSGWNYPMNYSNYHQNSYFLQLPNCWGWATWADRWRFFEKDPSYIIDLWSNDMKYRFTIQGANYNFWQQVVYNKKNKINTWAIFWYATIFQNNGLCLNPVKTLTQNIGNDGTGENCGDIDFYTSVLNEDYNISFPKFIELNVAFHRLIYDFYVNNRISIFQRLRKRLVNLLNK